MNTQETIFFQRHKTIIPYLEAYTSKIYENLCTIYGSKTTECFRIALKGQNSIIKQVNSRKKTEKGSLAGFLKTINLETIQYQLTIQINPNFNQSDYQEVMGKVCEKLFDSGYRIISGKSLQNFLDSIEIDLNLCPAPSVYNSAEEELPPDNTTKKYNDPSSFFGFWEETLQNKYTSSEYYSIRFVLDRSKKKNTSFLLEIPYLVGQHIRTITLIKIDIPTFENRYSRQSLWRELSDEKILMQYHPHKYPISNFLYNAIDTDKDNLKILLQLLSVYHESLNIFTMQRLSGIPRMRVLLYEDGQRDYLVKKIINMLYIDENILLKLDTYEIKHLYVLLQKYYAIYLKIDKYKIIISIHVNDCIYSYLESKDSSNENCIDQIEMNLNLIFNSDIYTYLIKFSEVFLFKKILHLLNENTIIRKSFLIPKLSNQNYWASSGFNYSQVYEYNLVSFDKEGNHPVEELLEILEHVDFSEIKECFNVKLVPAEKDDIKNENEYIKKNFLISEEKNCLQIYAILLINHVQKLYRKPVRMIKMKMVDSETPDSIVKINYNTKDIYISNQHPLLETANESHNVSSLVESLLFIKTLDTDKIDYKIRQNIVPDIKYKKIDELITYKNLRVKTLDDIIKDIQKII